MDYYSWRHNKLLYDEYDKMFTPSGVTAPSCGTNCFKISMDTVTFSNFGSIKPALSVPVAVNPAQQMQYTGQVLDLDGFDGTVQIYRSTFNNIALKYASCSVA
jgi:hypothetical protein